MRVRRARSASAARNHLLLRVSDDPAATIRLLDRLDGAERRLARFPFLGREGRLAGTRELVIAGTPYVYIYRVEEDVVVILDIRHGARA